MHSKQSKHSLISVHYEIPVFFVVPLHVIFIYLLSFSVPLSGCLWYLHIMSIPPWLNPLFLKKILVYFLKMYWKCILYVYFLKPILEGGFVMRIDPYRLEILCWCHIKSIASLTPSIHQVSLLLEKPNVILTLHFMWNILFSFLCVIFYFFLTFIFPSEILEIPLQLWPSDI